MFHLSCFILKQTLICLIPNIQIQIIQIVLPIRFLLELVERIQ